MSWITKAFRCVNNIPTDFSQMSWEEKDIETAMQWVRDVLEENANWIVTIYHVPDSKPIYPRNYLRKHYDGHKEKRTKNR